LALSLPIILGVLAGGCTTPLQTADPVQRSPLQTRAIETRTYENQDAKATLKTVLNVLQDEGFLVDYGNSDLGLLHANKAVADSNVGRFGNVSGGSGSGSSPPRPRLSPGVIIISPTSSLEATVNVSDFGDRIKVRISFQQKFTYSTGGVYSAAPVTDARFYQDFFAKLDRGLFIQKQGL